MSGVSIGISHLVISDSVTPWTVAFQFPLSMVFSRQEYWTGFPFPSPGVSVCACCMLSHFSCARLFAMLWTVALQALLSMEFSRQEYWTGLPCAPLVDLPDSGFKPTSLMSPILASGLFTI